MIKEGTIVVRTKDGGVKGYIGNMYKTVKSHRERACYNSYASIPPNRFRLATKEEIEWFNAGYTNIKDIPKEIDKGLICVRLDFSWHNSPMNKGDIFITVGKTTLKDKTRAMYRPNYSIKRENFRPATLEEQEAYKKGIRNINQINSNKNEVHREIKTEGSSGRSKGLYLPSKNEQITTSSGYSGNRTSIGRSKARFGKSTISGQARLY